MSEEVKNIAKETEDAAKDASKENEVKENSSLIEIKGLTKRYGSLVALDAIDLSVSGGKIIGLLGPNGSGKTTLIKILAGLLTKTSGEALVDGKEIGIKTKAVVSYLPERPYFSSWMTVEGCLKFFKDFYKDFDIEIARKMLKDLDIDEKKKLSTLSKGTKEKVQLILVMSRRAKLYLLDEPIAGVDPAARDYILETIISTYKKEATVIISTHLISDIESIIDEYIFIKYGNIVEHSSIKEFKEKNEGTLDARFREVFKYVR
jgi:ABC-2 type transport system ATP-binding protein